MGFPYVGRKAHIYISAISHTRVHKVKYVYEYLNRLRLKNRNFSPTRVPISLVLVIKITARLCNKRCNCTPPFVLVSIHGSMYIPLVTQLDTVVLYKINFIYQ